MNIIGCDLHTRYQVIAWRREETGELVVRQLEHESGEARQSYASLPPGRGWESRRRFPRRGSSADAPD